MNNEIVNRKILAVDRIVENKYVCEELETQIQFIFTEDVVPENTREGDIIVYANGELIYDESLTKDRKKYIANIFNDLFSK